MANPSRKFTAGSHEASSHAPEQILCAYESHLQENPDITAAEKWPDLERVAPDLYQPLLLGMLQREQAHRQQDGQAFDGDELRRRLPAFPALVEAVLNQDREPRDIAQRLPQYEYLSPIHGNPYGGAYKIRHGPSGDTRVLWRISAFFVDTEGLQAERAAAGMVHLFHPNIAAPIELLQHRGDVYVISEYFPGENLADLILRAGRRPLPVPVICEIFSQTARGLASIHAHFKAHADLRPANVLIGCRQTELGQVKLSGVTGGLIDEHRARFALWPAGLRFAPAFCAPEVASGQQAPDTRSDVFSLGRLVYATLLGQPPATWLGGSDTPEASPPLCRIRPDCPPDLEAAIAQMTAPDPDERFETAGDVLDVLQRYAVPSQLVAWVQRIPQTLSEHTGEVATEESSLLVFPICGHDDHHSDPAAATSHVPRQPVMVAGDGASAEPLPQTPISTVEPELRDATAAARTARGTWKQFPRRRPMLTLAGGLLLAMCLFGGSFLRNLPSPIAPANDPAWVADLITLPGPNGDWWFDEVPWYTPEVRSELARRIYDRDPELDLVQLQQLAARLKSHPDYETVDQLHAVVRELIRGMPSETALPARQIDEVSPAAHSVSELKEEYAGVLRDLPTTEQDSAARWHLRAVLLEAQSETDQAAEAYRQALERYAASSRTRDGPLKALCATDYARLLAEYQRNYRKANTYYRLAIEQSPSLSLKVTSMCRLADSLRHWNRSTEATKTLRDAQRTLQSDPEVLPEHPLHALIAETQGWVAFDNWQLKEATEAFDRAHQTRLAHSRSGNPRSWRAIIWIEQGQAMTAHFRGQQQQAQEKYRRLLERIDSSLRGGFIRDLPKQQRTELTARRPNLYERLADCYLFGAGIDHLEACVALDKAIVATEDPDFELERTWPHVVALKYKYSIALLLAGNRDEAIEAMQSATLDIQKRQTSETGVTEGQRRIFESTQTVAQSLLQMETGSPEQRQVALEQLQAFHRAASTKITRKNLNLLMLVTEQLLQPAQLPEDKAARIVRRLDAIIRTLKVRDTEGATSLYLQRYCESGQRALRNVNSVSLALDQTDTDSSIAAVLTESRRQAPPALRGLTRGTIEVDDAGRPVRCRLHVLTIGVSDYQHHPELQLTCAAEDAEALFSAYDQLCINPQAADSANQLFLKGEFRKLTNEQATRGAIIDNITDMARLASEKDLLIISLSGHGIVDEGGEFYFLPTDYRDDQFPSSGIRNADLRDFSQGDGNTILVLDACHSGAATSKYTRSAINRQVSNALARFTGAQKGLVVLAASASDKTAAENPRYGHGVLTLALLEAIEGRYHELAAEESRREGRPLPPLPHPQDNSGLITLHDIQYYVGSRVPGLTDGAQRTTFNRYGGDLSMRDIPIRFYTNDAE
ncbi:protein kinase domain-containing protein [Roseimaritima sediminicola]|uniref:protein kinase domain-containing protein n=1 Tax=Roseimaritima sediminicola TaxID=2662066 RepID=UPI00129846D2|nr:protein kinase [Roseimaritima sediminicola]